ncbi:MAG TPA: helix-turn-helix transcriptional regulator [Bryobacteraceae bacterium]
MNQMQIGFFRERLLREFETRRRKNPRYSLRALAAFLETDHSTLSQILRGSRRVPVRRIRGWARKLGIDQEETIVYIAAEHEPDTRTAQRQHQLRQWTAEALAIANQRAHWEILRLCRAPEFRADSRWIARQIGVDIDQVNLAFSRLLRLRLLEVSASGQWKDLTGAPHLTERKFRTLALARARELAAK